MADDAPAGSTGSSASAAPAAPTPPSPAQVAAAQAQMATAQQVIAANQLAQQQAAQAAAQALVAPLQPVIGTDAWNTMMTTLKGQQQALWGTDLGIHLTAFVQVGDNLLVAFQALVAQATPPAG